MSDRWDELRVLAASEPESERATIHVSGFLSLRSDVRDLLAERDALAERNAKLVAALREIAALNDGDEPVCAIMNRARVALQSEGSDR